MIIYPSIDPVAFQIGPLKVHWYGLMYLLGFFSAWALLRYRANSLQLDWSHEQISDIVFYAAIGVVLGGRLGYMLFYSTSTLFTRPWVLLEVWQGGMSFHGGLLGVLIALLLYAKHLGRSFFELTDFIAPVVPIGLGAGRVGNFINGELWGRVSDVPWAMVFPHVDAYPRHPSVIYEFLLEGVLLFTILWWYSSKPRARRAVSGMFLLCYGLFRCFIEFFRQPDPQLGYLAFNWLTMGQLLSLPMIGFGLYFIFYSRASTIQEQQ